MPEVRGEPEQDDSTFKPTAHDLGITGKPEETKPANPHDLWNYRAAYWPQREAGE
jgi:hypothetical protein